MHDTLKDNLAEDPEEIIKKSKTQLKKEMTELQDLGKKLITINKKQLLTLELPTELYDAILQAKKFKRGEALRRQTQHIGALMRTVDPEPIKIMISNGNHFHRNEVSKFHQIEVYRDALISGDPKVFDEISENFPKLDRQHLKQLVRNAHKEKEKNKAPKNFRLIFDYLNDLAKNSQI